MATGRPWTADGRGHGREVAEGLRLEGPAWEGEGPSPQRCGESLLPRWALKPAHCPTRRLHPGCPAVPPPPILCGPPAARRGHLAPWVLREGQPPLLARSGCPGPHLAREPRALPTAALRAGPQPRAVLVEGILVPQKAARK